MKTYSLAVPTFNRSEVLQKLMDTVPASVSVYISDNGSTLPPSIVKKYPNAVIGKTTPPVLMFENWNLAANSVLSDWLAIPSDDDIYYKDSFLVIEKYLNKYNDMDVIIFGHNTIDSNENILNNWKPCLETCIAPSGFLRFKYGVDARMPSIFMKTALFKKLGGFDEGFRITAADSDFLQRAALVGNIQFVPEVVSGYRVWEGGLTHNKIASTEWMKEIDRWCNRISEFCEERNINMYSKKIQDEIYARNLLAGVHSAKKSNGYMAAWSHVKNCRYPFKALVRTQLSLLYRLVRP